MKELQIPTILLVLLGSIPKQEFSFLNISWYHLMVPSPPYKSQCKNINIPCFTLPSQGGAVKPWSLVIKMDNQGQGRAGREEA